MSLIDVENSKSIRRAMNVICGIEPNTALIPNVTAKQSYDNVNGDVTGVPVFVQYMDLSGKGFPNDGSALPLEAEHPGIIAPITNIKPNRCELTVSFSGILGHEGKEAHIYYYDGDKLKNKELKYSGDIRDERKVTITGADRIQIVRVSAGASWWFDKSTLIGCNVSLRGVETKVDNPELQISDIEIIGYEPNNILEKVALIADNAPIYYTSGYPGDMSPVRKFYLSETIRWIDKQITIRGEDATKFLDKEYAGKYVGDTIGRSGGLSRYISTINDMITNANIKHVYENKIQGGPYSDGESFLIQNVNKREIIAQAVNLFRFRDDWLGNYFLNYVDAGIPKLTVNEEPSARMWNIEDYAELKIETQRKLKSVSMDIYYVDVGTSEAIETLQNNGTTIKSIANPYYSIAASSGTISLITPYKYKIKSSGTSNVTGRPIRRYDPTDDGSNVPYVMERDEGVEAVTLKEMCGLEDGASPEPEGVTSFWGGAFTQLLDRDVKTYSFVWRGDPRIQPRDYATIEIEGEQIQMTIESITLDHSDGGLTSQIVARGGII